MGIPVSKNELKSRIDSKGIYGWVDYNLSDIKGANTPFSYKCNICGHEQKHSVKSLLKRDTYCKKCKFINDSVDKLETDKFDYSEAIYTGMRDVMTIICPEHGELRTDGYDHQKIGCVKCNEDKRYNEFWNDYLVRFNEKYPNGEFTYEKSVYKGSDEKIEIFCSRHQEYFWKSPRSFLGQKCPCPICYHENRGNGRDFYITKFQDIHGDDFDYSEVPQIIRSNEKIPITCNTCGETFEQTTETHAKGHGCNNCAILNGRLSVDEMKKRAGSKLIRYNILFEWEDIKSTAEMVDVECPDHGVFSIRLGQFLTKGGCPKCSMSQGQYDVTLYIESLTNNVKSDDRKILKGKELDIYAPDHKLAIEYDGVRWHSEKFGKGVGYHVDKTNKCVESGIKLLHISDWDWFNKETVIKSLISSNIQTDVCVGDKEIKEINKETYREFLDENYIRGYVAGAVRYGIFLENELVSVIGLVANKRIDGYIINAFCNKLFTNYTNTFGELFNHFTDNHLEVNEIKYLIDRRYFDGKNLKEFGFKFLDNTRPQCYYYKGSNLIKTKMLKLHNMKKIIKDSELVIDEENSFDEVAKNMGYNKIWDCGKGEFVWNR